MLLRGNTKTMSSEQMFLAKQTDEIEDGMSSHVASSRWVCVETRGPSSRSSLPEWRSQTRTGSWSSSSRNETMLLGGSSSGLSCGKSLCWRVRWWSPSGPRASWLQRFLRRLKTASFLEARCSVCFCGSFLPDTWKRLICCVLADSFPESFLPAFIYSRPPPLIPLSSLVWCYVNGIITVGSGLQRIKSTRQSICVY